MTAEKTRNALSRVRIALPAPKIRQEADPKGAVFFVSEGLFRFKPRSR